MNVQAESIFSSQKRRQKLIRCNTMIATCHYATAERPESSCVRFMQFLADTEHKNILQSIPIVRANTRHTTLMSKSRKPVSKDALEAAICELIEGKPIMATAKKHNIDPTTLRRHAEKRGWKGSNAQYSAEYKREIMDSILAKESVTECAARTGIPAKTIYQWLYKAGYKSRPQYVAPEKGAT